MIAPESGGGQIIVNLIEKLEEEAEQRERQAKKSFDNFCRHEGLVVVEAPPAGSALSAASTPSMSAT